MTINIPLFTKVMVHIRRNPEQWDQDTWGIFRYGCDTTYCIAGWTAALTQARIVWHHAGEQTWTIGGVFSDEGEEAVSVSYYAQQQLGLTREEADFIFHSSNCTAWPRIEGITNGEITMEKIDAIIAEQDAARHRSDEPEKRQGESEKKTEDTKRDDDRTEPERTGRDDEESDGRDNEEPRVIRELVSA